MMQDLKHTAPSAEDILVSVIVPVMNAERFLDQCLDSIRSQTHRRLEILLINDGSTDSSSLIMQRHAALDSRIAYVDKKNEGYGATCNLGIRMSHGQYIAIVEPDDWIDGDMYKEMVSFALSFDESIDIVKTSYFEVDGWDDPARQSIRRSSICNRAKTSEKPFRLADASWLIERHPCIWTALYRRDFLLERKIRFPEYPGANWADNPFLIETLAQADTIVWLNRSFYYYRTDLPGSTTGHTTDEKISLPFRRWFDMKNILDRLQVKDRSIWQSLYVKGFCYAEGAMNDDGRDNPVVLEYTKKIFGMMDKDMVLGIPCLAPHRKARFLEIMGYPPEKIPRGPYMKHLIRESVYEARTNGIVSMIGRILRHG